MKKRILAFLLAAIMIVGILPTVAFAEPAIHDLKVWKDTECTVPAIEDEDYKWVTDNQLKILKKDLIVSGTTTKEYIDVNASVTNLTINNLSITTAHIAIYNFYGDATLTLVGDNTLTNTANTAGASVKFEGNGIITGTGDLTATKTVDMDAGIFANGSLTFTQTGTVTASGLGGIFASSGSITFSNGIGKILARGSSNTYGAVYGAVTLGNALTMKGSTAVDTEEANITGETTIVGNNVKTSDQVALSVLIKGATPTTYGIISEVQGHGSVTTKIGDNDVAKAVAGASVVFTATADEGYQFKEWVDVRSNANISGNTTNNPLTVTMPAAEIKIKAVFEKAAPTVTIETNGHGTVTARIGDMNSDLITDSTFTVPAGSKVILQSVADKGYHLNEWVDMRNNVTITNGNTFIMPDKDVKIKAVYSDTLRADYLSLIEGYYDNDMMPGDFSTLVNSDGMTQFMFGEGTLQTWDELDIVAEELIVSPDYEEQYDVSAGSYTSYVIVTSEGFGCPFYKLQYGKCQKTFNPVAGTYTRTAQPFNIIVEDDGHGMAEAQIDGTAVESAATGADVDLVITSTNEGYAFKEWQVIRGLESGAITDNSFTMPGNEVKIKAIFERVYNINIQDDGHGTAVAKIGDSEVTAAAGNKSITLVPQAAEGYELDQWEIVSGDFTITGNGFTMPESNVTIKATFKVKEVCDCEYTKTVKLTENGKYGMKLNCKDMGEFTFAQFDGGWSINNGSKYLAMKDGKLVLSDTAFAWTYKNNAFSASVKTQQKVNTSYGILGWLFGWGGKTTTKEVTTTYYLSTVTDGVKLSTCCVCAELYKTVTANEHDFGCWIDCKDGNHKHICKNCGEVETEEHSYDPDTHKCVCGAYDPHEADVKISVDVKEKTTKQFSGFLFWGTWKNVTTYTATIKTEATGVKVTKVQYQLNGSSKWMTGTSVSSDKPIETLKVKAWDSNGNVHEYTYSNN